MSVLCAKRNKRSVHFKCSRYTESVIIQCSILSVVGARAPTKGCPSHTTNMFWECLRVWEGHPFVGALISGRHLWSQLYHSCAIPIHQFNHLPHPLLKERHCMYYLFCASTLPSAVSHAYLLQRSTARVRVRVHEHVSFLLSLSASCVSALLG